MRTRIFIDFWNFDINWRDRLAPQKCDFRLLPKVIIEQVGVLLTDLGVNDSPVLEETLLYASIDPSTGSKTKSWLENTIDRLPSYRVKIRERRPRSKPVHCKHCGESLAACPNCQHTYTRSAEKGVDTAIVTDLMALAAQRSYDLAVLISGDADFVPAVEYLQGSGLKVINGGWTGDGHNLKKACWGTIEFDSIASAIVRS